MRNKPVIGFIGLGLMGHGMAKNILEGGYELWVRGRSNRTPIEDLVSMGAKEAINPKQLAEVCDIIHICLSNAPQIEVIMRSQYGILAGAKPGLIVVDTSTSDPDMTKQLAAQLRAKGGHFVDAPMAGTPAKAEAGQLSTMLGCDRDVLPHIRPVISCWAETITRIGETGEGHKMKLLTNFINLSYADLFSEATSLGAKVGIAPEKLREVISSSHIGQQVL